MPTAGNSTRTDVGPKSEHLRRAREAAEALFKPKTPKRAPAGATAQPAAVISEPRSFVEVMAQPALVVSEPSPPAAEPTTQPVAVVSEPSTRTARLLPVQKPQVAVAETVSHVKRKIVRNKISNSERSRIRVLASYGMTIEQVAALYEVTTNTIEKIIL